MYDTKNAALYEAKKRETGGAPQYVVKWFDGRWSVTNEMPLMGEWYTTDGIRHG